MKDVFRFFYSSNNYKIALDSFPTRRSSDLSAQLPLLCRVKNRCNSGGTVQKIQVGDRKSTRLNSSHSQISYAVFCSKKNILCSADSSNKFKIAEGHWSGYEPSYVSPTYHIL